MNLDSLSFALSQISYSVANLTKKNYKSSIQEISHLISQHGAEADRHLFRCLFSHVDFSGDGKSSGKDFHQTQYLNQECPKLITKPNFVSILCYAFDSPLHHQKSLKPSSQLLSQLSKVLKLSGVQEIAFALALQQSTSEDTRNHAVNFASSRLPPLIATYTDASGNSNPGLNMDAGIGGQHQQQLQQQQQPGMRPPPASQAPRPPSQQAGAMLSAAMPPPQPPASSSAVTSSGPPIAIPSTPANDASSIFPSVTQQFSKEIEDEANSYFQRIYNNTPHPTNISIDEVLDMLKRFKDSPVKKEREVFACMLRNLFEEYRFFHQYPDRELQTTAVLFGGIIEQGLVTYMDLGIALRYVLEALKRLSNTKMYIFGITALDRFKSRLKDYPQYCQHLASINHFNQFPSHLQEYIEYGSRSQEPPTRPQGPIPTSVAPQAPAPLPPAPPPAQAMPPQPPAPPAPASTAATSAAPAAPTPAASTAPGHGAIARPAGPRHGPSIATATNIDTLLAGQEKEEVPVPPEGTCFSTIRVTAACSSSASCCSNPRTRLSRSPRK